MSLDQLPRELLVHELCLCPTDRAALACVSRVLRAVAGRGENEPPLIWPGQALNRAIADNHVARVKSCLGKTDMTPQQMIKALRHNALDLLACLAAERGFSVPVEAHIRRGLFNADWSIIEMLHEYIRPSHVQDAAVIWLLAGRFSVVDDFYRRYPQFYNYATGHAPYMAIRHGRMDILAWFDPTRWAPFVAWALRRQGTHRGVLDYLAIQTSRHALTVVDCREIALARLVPDEHHVFHPQWASAIHATVLYDCTVVQALATTNQLARLRRIDAENHVPLHWFEWVIRGAANAGRLALLNWCLTREPLTVQLAADRIRGEQRRMRLTRRQWRAFARTVLWIRSKHLMTVPLTDWGWGNSPLYTRVYELSWS